METWANGAFQPMALQAYKRLYFQRGLDATPEAKAGYAPPLRTSLTIVLSWVGVIGSMVSPVQAQSAADYRQQGLVYRSQGQWAEAIEVLETAVELDPENLSGRVLLGWTAHRAGQDDRAAAVLQGTLEQDPFHLEALNALGIVYLVQGKVWPAIGTHGWAAFLKPDNEIAFYNLSLGLQRLGLWDWAIATAEYASVLEPDNPHPLVALALAHGSKLADTDAPESTLVTVVAATRQLDERYYDLNFLEHLEEAGFSPAQIAQTRVLFEQY
ncbi:MAG: tetratricopeptide repeat protein [Prochlorotrichaceae cyanobacterium]